MQGCKYNVQTIFTKSYVQALGATPDRSLLTTVQDSLPAQITFFVKTIEKIGEFECKWNRTDKGQPIFQTGKINLKIPAKP